MFELNSVIELPINLATNIKNSKKTIITIVIDKMSGMPFDLKKLYEGDRIIAIKRESKNGTNIPAASFTPASTIIMLAITIK
jgi:hypothetical protein